MSRKVSYRMIRSEEDESGSLIPGVWVVQERTNTGDSWSVYFWSKDRRQAIDRLFMIIQQEIFS
jgi:hypothetical protein